MATYWEELKREWPRKRFETMHFTKNQAPDLVVEVVKKGQTCSNWQREVEEGEARKTI